MRPTSRSCRRPTRPSNARWTRPASPTMPPESTGRTPSLRLALAPDAPPVMAGTADMLARVAPEIEVVCLADTSEDPGRVDFIVYDPQRHDVEDLTHLTRSSPDAL